MHECLEANSSSFSRDPESLFHISGSFWKNAENAALGCTFHGTKGSSSEHCLRRSAPHMGLLRDGLSALGHAARRRSLAHAVYAVEDAGVDCPSIMAAVMLQHRDNEVRFLPITPGHMNGPLELIYFEYRPVSLHAAQGNMYWHKGAGYHI